MQAAVKKPLKEDIVSMGGMIGGESKKLHALREQGKNICGDVVSKAIAYAVGVLEVNASMGLIVAAPTAGSSGVIPGTLCALQEQYGFTDDEICQALFNAAAIGYLITRNATTAGAEGGCQAEVGSASAMAASAAVELFGGTPRQCMDAASFAMVNILGLVCDPIGGLVEKPSPEAAPSNLYIVGRYLLSPLVMELLASQQPGKGGEIRLTDAMARSLDREAMYAVVIDPLSGYDTGTPSGWIATNALMAASDPRFAGEFWAAVDERGGLER